MTQEVRKLRKRRRGLQVLTISATLMSRETYDCPVISVCSKLKTNIAASSNHWGPSTTKLTGFCRYVNCQNGHDGIEGMMRSQLHHFHEDRAP